MLRDDLALLKMAWLNHAMSRYDTLNEVARDAARVLPLLQQEFTAEIDRTTTTGAIDKSVMEGEAARRAASDKHAGMTASEAGAAEADADQKIRSLKASLESEWERRGVDMTVLYHPAYGGIVRPTSLPTDRLGFVVSACASTVDPKSQSPETNREFPRVSACPLECCAGTSGPDRPSHTPSSATSARGSDPQ